MGNYLKGLTYRQRSWKRHQEKRQRYWVFENNWSITIHEVQTRPLEYDVVGPGSNVLFTSLNPAKAKAWALTQILGQKSSASSWALHEPQTETKMD